MRSNAQEKLPAVPAEGERRLRRLWKGDKEVGPYIPGFWALARMQYHTIETVPLLELLQEITEGAYTDEELTALLESQEVEGRPVHEKRKSGDLDLTELHRTHAIKMDTDVLHQWLGDAHYDSLPDPYGGVVLTGVAKQEGVSALIPIARQKALALADVYGLSLGFRPTIVWASTKMFTDQHGKRRRGVGFHIVFPVIAEPSKMAKRAGHPRRYLRNNPGRPLMPLTPEGKYPVTVERIGTAQQLMVRPNPPSVDQRFQRIYLRPSRTPKWFRDALKASGNTGGFTGAQSVFKAMQRAQRRWSQEHFIILTLDVKNRVTGIIEVTIGTLDAALVHPRDVFGAAVANAAAAVLLVHNHPSGDPEPSMEDVALTRRLADAGELMGIPILDHIVMGKDGYVSLAERGIV